MIYKKALLALMTIITSGTLVAAPKLTPGKWRITSTVEHPMMPGAQEQITEECITESRFDFKQLMTAMPTDSCEPIKPKTSGSTVSWTITCVNPVNPADKLFGKGKFTGKGKTGEGSLQMTITLPDIGEQSITSRWRYKHLGKCD